MRLTIRAFGHDLLDIEITTANDAGSPAPTTQDHGDSTSYPISFTAHMDRPHEMTTPDRDWS